MKTICKSLLLIQESEFPIKTKTSCLSFLDLSKTVEIWMWMELAWVSLYQTELSNSSVEIFPSNQLRIRAQFSSLNFKLKQNKMILSLFKIHLRIRLIKIIKLMIKSIKTNNYLKNFKSMKIKKNIYFKNLKPNGFPLKIRKESINL